MSFLFAKRNPRPRPNSAPAAPARKLSPTGAFAKISRILSFKLITPSSPALPVSETSASFSTRFTANPRVKGAKTATAAATLVSSATTSIKGNRHHRGDIEDVACCGAMTPDIDLFGIFDGHGGDDCSKFLAEMVPPLVSHVIAACGDDDTIPPSQFLVQALNQASDAYDSRLESKRNSGAVGVCVLITKSTQCVSLAHVGDCGVVLSRPGGGCVALTRPHHSGDPVEKQRLKAHGARIENDRFMGILSPSRAFGNLDLRAHSGGLGLTHEADTLDVELALDESGQAFLIIASDGVWDRLSAEEAADEVRTRLRAGGSALEAAEALASRASQFTRDDVTVTVIFWQAKRQ